MVTVDLQDKPQEFVDAYKLANPIAGARAKVPLLHILNENDDDNVFLCESLVVAEYIAETYNVLLPSSPEERAVMRLFTELCGASFSYFPLLRARGEKLDAALTTFREGLVAANAFLHHHGHHTTGPFLFGNTFSLAECNAAPFVQRACIILPAFTGQGDHSIKVNPLDICNDLDLVHLKRWMEAVLARPSVVMTGVPKEELLKGTTKMLERFAAMEQK